MTKWQNRYFDWLCQLVNAKRLPRKKLLLYLHEREFTYILVMDANRAEDGADLRYRFGYENGLNRNQIDLKRLGGEPCSVLEMMIALALRCEEHIMSDPEAGVQTGRWFADMIDSLGLGSMDDDHFDRRRAKQIIDRFLDRQYERDGRGGIFTVPSRYDMRTAEIWCQAMWYLDDILRNHSR